MKLENKNMFHNSDTYYNTDHHFGKGEIIIGGT